MQLCSLAAHDRRGVRPDDVALSPTLSPHDDSAATDAMEHEDLPSEAEATTEFQRALTDLIASAFARGAAIERTWEIAVPVAGAPNWTVTVEKTYSDEEPEYDPELLGQ